jgi:hypothetical protein
MMTRLNKLVVERYRTNRVPNPYPGGEMPGSLYYTARNAVVRACRRHGPVGPMGEVAFPEAGSKARPRWERGDPNPVYFVVDDWYNHEMYLYMEFVDTAGCTGKWLEDVTAALRSFRGWGIGVNSLPNGYLLIFADRLLVRGPQFRGCRDAASVAEAIRSRS